MCTRSPFSVQRSTFSVQRSAFNVPGIGLRFCAAASTYPEICTEVLSPANSPAEMRQETRTLFFEAGPGDVWIYDLNRRTSFHAPRGLLFTGVMG